MKRLWLAKIDQKTVWLLILLTTQIGTQIPQLGTRTGYPVFSINLDETVESEINTEEILNAFFLDIESILKIAEYVNCRVC